MKSSFLTGILAIAWACLGYAQTGSYSVSGELKDLKGRPVMVTLAEFNNGKFRPIDSTLVKEGPFSFSINQGKPGFYQLIWKLRRPQELGFVLSSLSPKLQVVLDPHNAERAEYIGDQGLENTLLGQASRIKYEQKKAIRSLKESYRNLSSVDPKYYARKEAMRDSVDQVRYHTNQRLEELLGQSPNSFVARFVVPLMIRPSLHGNAEYAQQFDGFTSLWHAHYFDNADLSDESILRSPELKDQLQDYFNEFAGRNPDENIQAINYVLSLSENVEVRRFIIRLSYMFFVAKESIPVLSHLETTFYSELTEEERKGLIDRAKPLLEVSLGQPFKDFDFNNCNCDYKNLNTAVQMNRATLLLFWSYECGNCEEELESMKLLYDEFHPIGLEIVAVNVNPDESKWRQTIKDKDYKWVHLHEPRGFAGGIPKLYSVQKTPTSYLIIHNGVIKGHDQSAVELKAIMSSLLK